MRNSLEELNSWFEPVEERLVNWYWSDQEYILLKNRNLKIKKHGKNFRGMWDNIKWTNIFVMGVPREEEAVIPSKALWSSWAQRLTPISLITGNSLHSATMTFPELQWANSTSCEFKKEEEGTTEDEMVGWHHPLSGYEFEWALGVGDGQGSLECCSPWGCKESDMTKWLNWTEDILRQGIFLSTSNKKNQEQPWTKVLFLQRYT